LNAFVIPALIADPARYAGAEVFEQRQCRRGSKMACFG
jgi:hypothetical protein